MGLFSAKLSAQEVAKNVLYLNSYNLGYDWSDLVMEGIYEVLNPLSEVDLYTELLDGKRFPDIPYTDSYLETIRAKYAGIQFDAILCSDNFALDWLLAHRDDPMLKGLPVAFCGISNPADYEGIEGLLGVIEERDFERLVEAIHKGSPGVTELHLILDNTPTGYEYRNAFEAFRSDWSGQIDFHYHNENSVEDIPDSFGKLGQESAVFYTVLSVGKGGEPIKNAEFLPELVKWSPVPVFGDVLAAGSNGIIGGPTNDAVIQGRMSAELILKILNGQEIEPNVVKPDIDWRFDYTVMKRFGLKEENFPEEAVLFNRPVPVFQIYKTEIIGTAVLVLLLICLVVLLAILLYLKKRYERELLLEKEKAEESDRLKSAFLANISHEIRTPLNAVIGFSGILQEDEALDESLRPDVEHIINGGYELRDTVTNIMDYSCLESGPLEVVKREVSMGELLSRLRRQDLLNSKPLERLEVVNHLGDGFRFQVDGTLLLSVLSHLVHNGLKFSGTSMVQLSVTDCEQGVRFCVADTGIGVDANELELVFTPFHKAMENNAKAYTGAGLGLAIVRRYVDCMGGRVWLESEKGKGTKAFVELPLS